MATATYRIGPSDFFTPGDLKADADTLNGQINALDAQIEGSDSIDQGTIDQWRAWLSSWQDFYGGEFGGFFRNLFTALNDSNRDQLIQFESTFANFASEFATAGAHVAGGVVAPSSGSKDTIGDQLAEQVKDAPSGLLPSGTKIIIALVVVAVIVFLWKKP